MVKIEAPQAAAVRGCYFPASITRCAQSLSSKGQGKVSYDQEHQFEDNLMDDNEELDVRRSRVSSPEAQSIRAMGPPSILPMFTKVRTSTPRNDPTPCLHHVAPVNRTHCHICLADLFAPASNPRSSNSAIEYCFRQSWSTQLPLPLCLLQQPLLARQKWPHHQHSRVSGRRISEYG